jgi:hypothetical protein
MLKKRKSITVPFLDYALNEMKTRFTDLHARTVLGLQLVASIIENIAPEPPPPVNRVSGSAPETTIPNNLGKFAKATLKLVCDMFIAYSLTR